MPTTSKKQADFMRAVAHSPEFAKKVGAPQSVGKEFSNADKSRKFAKGGDMKESKAMIKKEVGFMKKAGAPKAMIKHEQAEMKGMKKGGTAKYAKGGVTRADGVVSKGHTKGKMVAMAYGGKTCK